MMSGAQASDQSVQQQNQQPQPLKRKLPSSMGYSESDTQRASSTRIGSRRLKWTPEEEEALLAGVAKHGRGMWKNILKDPDFAPFLTHRSNIDLKDKWRNMKDGGTSSRSREKSITPELIASTGSLPVTSNSAMKDQSGYDISAITSHIEQIVCPKENVQQTSLAAESVKEAERVTKMAEVTDSMLQLVKKILENRSQAETFLSFLGGT